MINRIKKTYIAFLLLGCIFTTAFGFSNHQPDINFLAPRSNVAFSGYKHEIFAGILSKHIVELNSLRSDRDAFFNVRQKLEKAASAFCPGDFSVNTLDEGGKYIRCSFLEKTAKGSFYTHIYFFDKKGKLQKYSRTKGDKLYKTQVIRKILNVINSGRKDYSLDEYIFITDPHGAYYNILDLLAHKFDVEYEDIRKDASRIEDDIIKKAKRTNYKFNFNGDIPDRAPYPLKTYRLVKRILNEVPGSMYQTGNHDLWAMLNVMGYHLPFYEGYKGVSDSSVSYVALKDIPADCTDFTEEEFVENETTHKLAKVNLKQFLDSKRKEYMSAADKTWWADQYRKFMQSTKKAQKEKWSHLNDAVTPLFKGFYGNMEFKDFMNDSSIPEDEKKFWGDILGFSFVSRVKVSTGFLSVERMPFSWWEQRENFLNQELLPRYKDKIDITALTALKIIMADTTGKLKHNLKQKAAAGLWTDIIINEGINEGTFESLEWMVADWGFHGADKKEADLRKGSAWGPSAVFERINEVLLEHGAEAPWEDGQFSYYEEYKIRGKDGNIITLPNSVNYLEDKEFIAFGEFLKNNFSIVSKDIYQNTYMHAFFPVKEIQGPGQSKEYKPAFDYDGKEYTGRDIFEGMEIMEQNIVKADNISDLHGPLSLYNSWFAEATTSFKPQHLKNYYAHGIARILDPAAVNILFSGHMPLKSLGEVGIGTNIDNRMFCGDNDMSPVYRDMGLYFDIGINSGVGIYGYSHEESKITKNPRISRKDKTKFSGARYHGISRREYLDSLRWDLIRKLNYMFLKSNNVSHYYSLKKDKIIKKAA